MQLTDFMQKVEVFFQNMKAYLVERWTAANATGAQGKAGSIRVASEKIYLAALEQIKVILYVFPATSIGAIRGHMRQAQAALQIEAETDQAALDFTPQNLTRAREAHAMLRSSTLQLIDQVNSLQEAETEVAEVNSAPIMEQPAIFDRHLVMERNGFIEQYKAKIQRTVEFSSEVVAQVPEVPEVLNTSHTPKPF